MTTRTKLSRTLFGVALTVALSTFTLAPASAATLPVITWDSAITDGAAYVFGQVPAAPTCTAMEDAAAVPCSVAGYDTAVGQHTLIATAVAVDDPALVATETITYTVTGWTLKGFYRPVQMDTVNRVKGGSTVPLKFKVYIAGKKAGSENVVMSLTAQQYDCTTGAFVGTAVPIASNHKGYRLKYRDGAFHQNWKTPKLAKPAKVKGKHTAPVAACYLATLTTQDASTLSAMFMLK